MSEQIGPKAFAAELSDQEVIDQIVNWRLCRVHDCEWCAAWKAEAVRRGLVEGPPAE